MQSQLREGGIRVSAVEQILPLHLLQRGEIGEIDQLVGESGHVQRLQELGLRCGVRVEMLQPGSPCIIRMPNDQRLCFRECESFGILVRSGGSI